MLRESIRDGRRLNRPAPRATPRAVSERGVNAPHDHEEYQPGERIRTEATSCQHRKGHEAEQGVMLIATANEDASLAVQAVAASLFHRAAPKNEAVILFGFSLRPAKKLANFNAEHCRKLRNRLRRRREFPGNDPADIAGVIAHAPGKFSLRPAAILPQFIDSCSEEYGNLVRCHGGNIPRIVTVDNNSGNNWAVIIDYAVVTIYYCSNG